MLYATIKSVKPVWKARNSFEGFWINSGGTSAKTGCCFVSDGGSGTSCAGGGLKGGVFGLGVGSFFGVFGFGCSIWCNKKGGM